MGNTQPPSLLPGQPQQGQQQTSQQQVPKIRSLTGLVALLLCISVFGSPLILLYFRKIDATLATLWIALFTPAVAFIAILMATPDFARNILIGLQSWIGRRRNAFSLRLIRRLTIRSNYIYDIHISHVGEDDDWADWIEFYLKKHGRSVTRPSWDGAHYVDDMIHAFRDARYGLTLLSSNYLKKLRNDSGKDRYSYFLVTTQVDFIQSVDKKRKAE